MTRSLDRSAPVRSLLSALLLAASAACGGGDGSTSPPPPPPVTIQSVVLTPATLTLVGPNQTATVSAAVTASTGPVASPTVTWASSNSAVATVSGAGGSATITSVAPGTTTVTATSGGVVGSAVVTVNPASYALTVTLAGDGTGTVTSSPAGISCTTASCSASFPAGTSVTLTPSASAGSAIDPWTGGCSGTGPCVVVMDQPRAATAAFRRLPAQVAVVTVSPSTITLDEGNSAVLTLSVRDATGATVTGRTVTWRSSDTTLATVSPNGVVTGILEGDPVQVSATVDGISGTATVSVRSLFLKARSVSAGADHTCAVRTSGGVWCWGSNQHGKQGRIGDESGDRLPMTNGAQFVQVVASTNHSCALDAIGTAYCVGWGPEGQLGDSTLAVTAVPRATKGGQLFARIYRGTASSCATTAAGVAYCWGYNRFGMLGVGTGVDAITVPSVVVGGYRFKQLSPGSNYVCGISQTDDGMCWGLGGAVLGNGTTQDRGAPAPLAGGLRLRSIAAWGSHACGIDLQGAAWCWGRNHRGQLGTGTGDVFVPTRVSSNVTFTDVSVGDEHSCALSTSGAAYCWGGNTHGQLGDGTNQLRALPVQVQSGSVRFKSISTAGEHNCAIATDDRVFCWGQGLAGRIGTSGGSSSLPLAVSRPGDARR